MVGWSEDETLALIAIWSEDSIQRMLEGCKSIRRCHIVSSHDYHVKTCSRRLYMGTEATKRNGTEQFTFVSEQFWDQLAEHEITAGHRPMADQRTLLADQMKRLHGHFDNTHMYTHCHGGLASPISLVVLLKSVSELEAEQNADPSCTYAKVNGRSYGCIVTS